MKLTSPFRSIYLCFPLIMSIILFISFKISTSNNFVAQKAFGLSLRLTAHLMNRIIFGILFGCIMFYIFIKLINIIWLRIISNFINLHINLKISYNATLVKNFIVYLLSFLTLSNIILYLLRIRNRKLNYILLNMLIYLIFIFVISKKNRVSVLISLFGKIFKALISRTSIALAASIFLLINLGNLYFKYFSPKNRPNVLLFVFDALRPDHLGCYGYTRPTSPNIDNFAAKGTLFEKAYSNSSWTKPSIASLFTSLYPHEHKSITRESNLDNRLFTLAEFFQNRYYKTVCIQTNPFISNEFNFNQGFCLYVDMINKEAKDVTETFLSWLNYNSKKPFFAYLHYMDTHFPYNSPQEYISKFGKEQSRFWSPTNLTIPDLRVLNKIAFTEEDRKSLVNRYDGAINYIDYNFSLIVDKLADLNLLNKTIIIITADHGEELFDHDNIDHGHSLYEEIIRVPLIIGGLKSIPQARIKMPFQLKDLFPLIISLAGINKNSNISYKQVSSEQSIHKTIIFAEGTLYGDEKKALIVDNWKLIENTGIFLPDNLKLYGNLTEYLSCQNDNNLELYDLTNDPKEQINLCNNSERLRRLFNLLKKYRKYYSIYNDVNRMIIRRETERFRSLGYIR